MSKVFFWYAGLFLITFSLGMNRSSRKERMVFLCCVIPVCLIEPVLVQVFHLPLLPPTFFLSFLVNGVETGGFVVGWIVGDKLRVKEKVIT